jgi:hypothetical protein
LFVYILQFDIWAIIQETGSVIIDRCCPSLCRILPKFLRWLTLIGSEFLANRRCPALCRHVGLRHLTKTSISGLCVQKSEELQGKKMRLLIIACLTALAVADPTVHFEERFEGEYFQSYKHLKIFPRPLPAFSTQERQDAVHVCVPCKFMHVWCSVYSLHVIITNHRLAIGIDVFLVTCVVS